MKKKISNQLKMLLMFLFGLFSTSGVSQNVTSSHSEEATIAILSQSLRHQNLWNEVPANLKQVTTYTILHHGVELNLPENTTIDGIPVEIIEKDELHLIGNQPYFIVHTFHVESAKALVRLYLTYMSGGSSKTSNVELFYSKDNGGYWNIETTTF